LVVADIDIIGRLP